MAVNFIPFYPLVVLLTFSPLTHFTSRFGDYSPVLGFSWVFHIFDEKNIVPHPISALTGADWGTHILYLR
jgi:hypothetical protein